jgi:hypothetical protein
MTLRKILKLAAEFLAVSSIAFLYVYTLAVTIAGVQR